MQEKYHHNHLPKPSSQSKNHINKKPVQFQRMTRISDFLVLASHVIEQVSTNQPHFNLNKHYPFLQHEAQIYHQNQLPKFILHRSKTPKSSLTRTRKQATYQLSHRISICEFSWTVYNSRIHCHYRHPLSSSIQCNLIRYNLRFLILSTEMLSRMNLEREISPRNE